MEAALWVVAAPEVLARRWSLQRATAQRDAAALWSCRVEQLGWLVVARVPSESLGAETWPQERGVQYRHGGALYGRQLL